MKTGFYTLLKLWLGAYFVFSSVYCLLAYLPYTYVDVIKAPPYAWMPWFAHWHALLYWPILLAAGIVAWKVFGNRFVHWGFGGLILLGIFLTIHPFMKEVQPNNGTYIWSLILLVPLIGICTTDLVSSSVTGTKENGGNSLLGYSTAIKASVLAALLFTLSAMFRRYMASHSFVFFQPGYDSAIVEWSLISHITIALVVLSVLNLIQIVTIKRKRGWRLLLLGGCSLGILWWVLASFLNNALSFGGWLAQTYAAFLALTLTLFGFSVTSPLPKLLERASRYKSGKTALGILCLTAATLAVIFPYVASGMDWNGMFQSLCTIIFWLILAVTLYVFRPQRRSYSLATILGVLIFTVFGYKALQATEIFWAKPLGLTDDSISRAMDLYAAQDASFSLAHSLLAHNDRQPCLGLCRVMRQYANIRNTTVKNDVTLVEQLVPNYKTRPNIFIFVIDSLRPDYLGAYNPKVDFTPEIDKFAKDSVPIPNAYTPYAGTSLSEPAIWSGTLLLHSHYQQPFHKLNNLERLAQNDGYQMIVSWDFILRQILAPSPDLIKLDTDKPLWNNFEVCSTMQQLEHYLDTRTDRNRPIFFYTQPQNVHQFAKNDVPKITSENWRTRPDFNNRIAYELNHVDGCLGGFFDYLRARNLYDNSIIILTSDHGDATGELGRNSHSIIVYPEVMRVPLIIHLPKEMKKNVLYDSTRISTLTDITPTLYYLLGHRPILHSPMFGRPLFMQTEEELQSYKRNDVFFASDVRAVFGLLEDHGRFFYAAYDSPAQSMLFDLTTDPQGTKNILTDNLKKQYDKEIIEHLQAIGDFYGYKPGISSLLASKE